MTSVAVPGAVLERARAVAREVTDLAAVEVDASELLLGRAALLGLQNRGRISAGGASRLLQGPDGWCALTLSRPDDVDAVPALVEADAITDPWDVVQQRVREVGVAEFAQRARLLGLPVGVLGEAVAQTPVVQPMGRPATLPLTDALVVDLSSMWAGPLCGALLARAGATVVKVETAARPDGTRSGPRAFFDWINGDKLSYCADLTRPAPLQALLSVADIVIESSRPDALRRRGLGPHQVPARPGRVWLRITGHGTDGPRAEQVAFGDDAAVAGGLVDGPADTPLFCGDAIADPLTGLHAAHAVLASRHRGGGDLIDMSMAAVAAGYAHLPRGNPVAAGSAPDIRRRATNLGDDNDAVDRIVADRLAGAC
ncbi:CoA transferase [Mycobacterium sp. SMC-4]|uniref:CoA transferase n=1 Tax=Mycobacterium sp. SMC-4 TaxID=2857059 RepID=UPI003CFC157B